MNNSTKAFFFAASSKTFVFLLQREEQMPTKLRILFVGDVNSIHLRKWVESASEQYTVGVFSLDNLKLDWSFSDKNSIQFYIPKEINTNTRFKLKYLGHLKRLNQAVSDFAPDVMHAHYASSYGLLSSLTGFKKLMVSVWGSDVYEFPNRSFFHALILRRVLRSAEKVFSTSEDMKLEASKYCSKPIYTIPFGVDMTLFAPTRKNDDQIFVVGTVKSLEAVYGIDRLLKVFALFNQIHPLSKCVIYGKGSREVELKNLADSLGLNGKVEFKGEVANKEVPDALNEIDVFCVLSRAESFGVSAVEASSCQLPVIASNVGGLHEVVKDGVTGFLVDAENTSEVLEKLENLYLKKNLRIKMGEEGRRLVAEKFDWKMNSKQLFDHYSR
jgi:glycosyltransferase involved in cell wall biosynthesis